MTKAITVIMWVYYICWIIPCWAIGGAKPRKPSKLMWRMARYVAGKEAANGKF